MVCIVCILSLHVSDRCNLAVEQIAALHCINDKDSASVEYINPVQCNLLYKCYKKNPQFKDYINHS